MTSTLEVFKQDNGQYTWLVISSNAYVDREGEIVSQAALEADAARMDATKEYGPLRWWHMGEIDYGAPLDWTTAQAGQGLEIGDCTFAAMHGRMLVEGGTFRSKEIGAKVAAIAPTLMVSRGFTHPMDEPKAGVYHNIRGVERSLLPAGREANSLTALAVTRGKPMASLKEKFDEFTKLFFEGDPGAAKEFAGQVAQKDFDAEATGQAFKQMPAGTIANDSQPGFAHTHTLPPTPATVKEDMPPVDPAATPETDSAEAGSDGMPLVGDMTLSDLVSALAPAIANAIAAAVQPTQNELDATKAALDTTQKELATLKGATTKEASDVAALAGRVKALEGDAPSGVHIPSRDNPAKTKEDMGIKPKPQPNDIDAVVDLLFANTQPVS